MSAATENSCITKAVAEKVLYNFSNKPSSLINFNVSLVEGENLGFLGEYYFLHIKYVSTKTSTINQESFFVKSTPEKNENQKEYVKGMNIFSKEILCYKKLISPFLSLVSVPFAAKCYFSEEGKFFVLQNLGQLGFKVSDNNYLSQDQMVSAMKTLGRFHAASLIFEEHRSVNGQKYRINEHFPEITHDSTYSYVEGHPRQKWIVTVTEAVNNLIKLKFDKNTSEKLCRKFEKIIFEDMPKYYLRPSEKFRNVLIHDDLWCNNMMFNDKLDCVFIDFQLTKYSPPGYDILVTLYMNLSREAFENNKNYFIEKYYEALSEELLRHQLEPQTLLPWEELQESLNYYAFPTLVEAVLYGTNVYIPHELIRNILEDFNVFQEFMYMDRAKYLTPEYQSNGDFKNRFDEVFIPFIEQLQKF